MHVKELGRYGVFTPCVIWKGMNAFSKPAGSICGAARHGWSLLPAKSSEVTEAYQSLALFIPETEAECFEAGEQREGRHFLKQRLRFVAPLQIVIGDPGAQMMNMMKADAAREPLQNPG